MKDNKIKVALFGFGCVGQGLYDVLNHSEVLQADISKICVKDPSKKRTVEAGLITFDKNDILDRNDLDVVVEMINDTEEAFAIVKRAMQNNTSVVSASKKMLATYFEELYHLQLEHNVALIYEGSAGGSIPIIRTLEEYYDNELLSSLRGILNGTTNYILTRMELESKDYSEILKDAQTNGFAEIDPWLDVAGFDTLYKLCLLSVHAFGVILKPDSVLTLGIQNVTFNDIRYAREKGLRIKLVASAAKVGDSEGAGKFRVYVMPRFVSPKDELFKVLYEYNGIEVEGAFSCTQTFTGKGAGSHPTGSAVLSDISALTYDYKYSYKKLKKLKNTLGANYSGEALLDTDFTIRVYIRYNTEAELKDFDIKHVVEEYRSPGMNFIIADVAFASLYKQKGNKESKVFVCEVE
ncbi:MAG TPA: homoserine dehydrogenase [Bacteroidia bacterium]|jgi:homoserine dehydrogenase|nr:homoserine dehydrogenase [Bacteroidia bacterium]